MKRYRSSRRYRTRYKRRGRSKTRVRYAKRGIFLRPRTRAYPEVKYADIYLDQKGILMETMSAGATLRPASVLHNTLLDNIPVGTARNNRIGAKIHVKKIVINQAVNICAFNSGGVSYRLNSILYRLMVTDATSDGTNITDYFSNGACRDRMINPLNRRNYNIYFDKRYDVSSGYVNTTGSDISNAVMAGKIRYLKAVIPVNRTIEYTDSGAVKECQDNYTVAAIATAPNYFAAGDVAPVVACVNSFVRIYYTDN